MPIDSLIPRMFHRRLLLLGTLGVVGLVPLGVQMSRLTLVRGEELRRDAEGYLVRSRQTATARGNILDRKGRILAQDRPSYDLAADFAVITGEWVDQRAQVAARHYAGAGWADLRPEQRRDLIDRMKPAFRVYLHDAWEEVARVAGVEPSTLDARRDEVIRAVDSRLEAFRRQLRKREIDAARAADGKPADGAPDAPTLAMIEKRVSRATIVEQTAAHVLVPRIPDPVAFALQGLESDEVELAIEDPYGDDRPPLVERVAHVPGLRVFDSGERDYPYDAVDVTLERSSLPSPLREDGSVTIRVEGVACHILGAMRDRIYGTTYKEPASGAVAGVEREVEQPGDARVRAEFLDAHPGERERAYGGGVPGGVRDRGAYREGDRVGDMGVERSQENMLRGLRGMRTVSLKTGGVSAVPAVIGHNVTLTLDIALQARVQAIMSPAFGLAVVQPWQGQKEPTQKPGDELHGAAVVLDVDTGDVLAMVSTPTYSRRQLREDPAAIYGDPLGLAYMNRAVSRPYQPGSIVKPLILCGAVQHGDYHLSERIACTGHLYPDKPNILQCWIYKQYKTTHSVVLGHDLDGSDAIMESCNIFFFTLGRRLGVEGITGVYREWGIGHVFDLGLVDSRMENVCFPGIAGHFPGPGGVTPALGLGDATQMGIGQGPVAWTPVHAASAYATLARAGVMVEPRLIMGQARPEPTDLGLDQRVVATALEGLERCVNDLSKGTGSHLTIDGVQEPIFNAQGVRVWGKTGTAAASPIVGDPDGEGPLPREVLARGDHSWFVVMAGHDRPRYVIAVVVDFGGSGGKVSGPIANQIIHALQAEGYL